MPIAPERLLSSDQKHSFSFAISLYNYQNILNLLTHLESPISGVCHVSLAIFSSFSNRGVHQSFPPVSLLLTLMRLGLNQNHLHLLQAICRNRLCFDAIELVFYRVLLLKYVKRETQCLQNHQLKLITSMDIHGFQVWKVLITFFLFVFILKLMRKP